jgi:hypothetical protein
LTLIAVPLRLSVQGFALLTPHAYSSSQAVLRA